MNYTHVYSDEIMFDKCLTSWQLNVLMYYILKQRGKSEKIAENMVKIEEWKEKSDSLLYNMIPKSVAGKLKSGEDPIATCEVCYNLQAYIQQKKMYFDKQLLQYCFFFKYYNE